MFIFLCFFIFFVPNNLHSNALPWPQQNASDNRGYIYSVSIFTISNDVYLSETKHWGDDYRWNEEWFCDNLFNRFELFIFPDEWMGDAGQNASLEWHDFAVGFCHEKCTPSAMAEFRALNPYEPKGDLTKKLLLKVIAALTSKFSTNMKFHIKLFTNFAEKSLVKALPGILENNNRQINRIQIVPMTIAAANYYYQAINHPKDVPFRFSDRFINTQNYFLKELNKNWHQIYILGFSMNLTNEQHEKIVNAAKLPMEAYFAQKKGNRTEPISFMVVGKQEIYGPSPDYQFCEDEHYAVEECFKHFRLSREVQIDTDLINYSFNHISKKTNNAIQSYYAKIFGAKLPPEQKADSIMKEQIQPKPRIVLITDYVEMEFINSNIPIKNGFEFKVYALNKVVAEYFEGKANLVIQIDPDNPPNIPFTRQEEENSHPKKKDFKADSKTKNFFAFSIALGLGCVVGIILLMSTFIYWRRFRRVDWLHRLEQFKTQHLFDAYMNEKRMSGMENEKKELDCWEVGWNQIILTNEQLGKGAFGEVRKATLTSFEASNSQNQLEIAVKMLPIYASENTKKNFTEEIKIMKLLGNGHQCVVKMLGCMSKGEGALGIVLEFCTLGSLLDHLNKSKVAEEEERQKLCRPFSRWAWHIADGMVFLAGKNLVHRDLAARNVLLDQNSIAKISDFGLCISFDNKLKKESKEIGEKCEKLPIFLLAPECLERKQFSEKSDIWSFGLLLHEIYTFGTNPFSGIEFDKLLNYIREYQAKRPEFCPELIYEIMQKCLLLNFIERPTFIKIKEKLTRILEKETVPYGYMDLCMPE